MKNPVCYVCHDSQIDVLLDSLIGALSTAIDERSPYNAHHTRNMVRCAEAFLDWLEQTDAPWQFDEDRRRAFLMSVWLHDVGKLAVPQEIMDKSDRLGPLLGDLRGRFRVMALLDRVAALEGRLDPRDLVRRRGERDEALALLERFNTADCLTEAEVARVRELGERTYTDEDGAMRPWLTEAERRCLSVRWGTLTEAERRVMESHALATRRILSQVRFPEEYADAPIWAASHHELLDGSGYPDRLRAEDIPPEVRLLTILDIFDALTAQDRPYRPAMSTGRALSVLRNMVREGALDGDILALFEQSRAWEARE